MSIRTRKRAAGYVLLMTLVLITLMGVALSRVVQQSLELAKEARERQDALQRKWALHGLRLVVLDRADEIIASRAVARSDGRAAWPEPHQIELEIPLGKFRYRLLLADEDAKAHLNVSDKSDVVAHASRVVSRLAPQAASFSLSVAPYIWGQREEGARGLESWGEVFVLGRSGDATMEAQTLRDATGQITCWGSDRINLRRAPDRVLDEVLGQILSEKALKQLKKLRSKRDESQSLDDMLRQLQLDSDDYFAFRKIVSEHGTSYTLWVESVSQATSRVQLLVRNPGGPGAPRRLSFEW